MSRLFKTVTVVSLSVLLSACSTSHESKRQIIDNEGYLDSPELKPLMAAPGIVLPLQYGDYTLPAVAPVGEVGKALDIRPPLQPLALLPGSRAQSQANQAEIRFESSGINLGGLVQSVMQSKNYSVLNSGVDDATQRQFWTTDWVRWDRKDEQFAYEARYEVSAIGNGYTNIIHVKLNELRHQDSAVANPAEISRYTVMMLNSLIEGVYVEQNNQSAQAAASQVGSFVVQSSTDETGLPLIIVRSPYAVVWQALPGALSNANMTISESNRSNGLITLKYRTLSSGQLDKLGVSDVPLRGDDYTLQVGDLGNRASLQFRTNKGQPLSAEQNEALVALMQAAFNQTIQS